MEFKRDYFPRMKAPDIAKKKVMQYVYGNKKNLTKRFYFYKIYTPAFLLLFIVWGGLSFYNKEIRNNKPVYSVINNYSESEVNIPNKENSIDDNANTVYDDSPTPTPTQETSTVDSLVQKQGGSAGGGLTATETTMLNDSNTIADANSLMMAKSVMINESSSTSQDTTSSLNQQISDLENLMNDISSITNQEENLF